MPNATPEIWVNNNIAHMQGFTEENHTIVLYNALGEILLNTNFSGADFSLLLPELPTGIYVISVMGAGSVYQQSVYVY